MYKMKGGVFLASNWWLGKCFVFWDRHCCNSAWRYCLD